MSEPQTAQDESRPLYNGIYLAGDTPKTLIPLAVEDGAGDKNLLPEAIAEQLTLEELDELIQDLIEESNRRAGNETKWEVES